MKSVRFADDQAMIATSEAGLQRMMDKTNVVVEEYGMRMNVKKTKVMCISREPTQIKVQLNGEELEQVTNFKYLGSMITQQGTCQGDVKARIAMAKIAFQKNQALLVGPLKLRLKKRLGQMLCVERTVVWV